MPGSGMLRTTSLIETNQPTSADSSDRQPPAIPQSRGDGQKDRLQRVRQEWELQDL